jgi:hypothetical protein
LLQLVEIVMAMAPDRLFGKSIHWKPFSLFSIKTTSVEHEATLSLLLSGITIASHSCFPGRVRKGSWKKRE